MIRGDLMAKQDVLELEGEILEALPNAMFQIKLENGHIAVSYTHLTLPTM